MDDNGGNNKRSYVTNLQLQLEIKALRADARALRSDVKVWIVGAVALNQFLSAVAVPSVITGSAIALLLVKGVLGVVFRG